MLDGSKIRFSENMFKVKENFRHIIEPKLSLYVPLTW